MYNLLKTKYPNLYILLITISMSIWFRIVGNCVDMFAPKNNILLYYLIITSLALSFLYFNDFSLLELHKGNSAIIASSSGKFNYV